MIQRDKNKLPLWAQHLVEKLEADVSYWKEKANAVAAGPAFSNVFIDDMIDQKKRALPPNSHIGFRIGGPFDDGRDIITCNPDRTTGSRLIVRAQRSLIVRPHASNTIMLDWE